MRGAEIAQEARSWAGVPYLHQGRSRLGVDCIGFVICVRSALAPWPESQVEVRNYGRRPKGDLLLERITAHCTELDGLEEGCVLLMRWPSDKHASHCAIHAGGNILHSYQRVNRVVETGYRAYWPRLTTSVWRLPGVTA